MTTLFMRWLVGMREESQEQAETDKPSTDESEYNEHFRHYHEENPDYFMTDGHTSMGDNS